MLYEDAKRIVVRDFNLEDPDIAAYITDQNGGHHSRAVGLTTNSLPMALGICSDNRRCGLCDAKS